MIYILLSSLIALLYVGHPIDNLGQECDTVHESDGGWTIEVCRSDPNVNESMQISVNGSTYGQAVLARIYHQPADARNRPQVAVIYASGYIRLKQNEVDGEEVPFGTSFVLGPAYWSDEGIYVHNPQLTRLDFDTKYLPNGPLRIEASGTASAFEAYYQMMLPPSQRRQTRLHVIQETTAIREIRIDATRLDEAQGIKIAQFSTMFVNEESACDGGHAACHDANAVRAIGGDLTRIQRRFEAGTPNRLVFQPPIRLGNNWVDVLHTDDTSWQGNTPNARIVVDELPNTHSISIQGFIASTSEPSDDNVGIWLHDDNPDSAVWTAEESRQYGYWFVAQDDPFEPWADLNLRTGLTFEDFGSTHDCRPTVDAGQQTSAQAEAISGYSDSALQLRYNVGDGAGNWAQIRCDFDPPLDLSNFDHLRFDWRGDGDAANSLEVGLINPGVEGEHIFARGYHHVTQRDWWGQLVIPFRFLQPWTPNTAFDPSQVSAFFISVVKDPVADEGSAGTLAIDNLNAYRTQPLPPSDSPETTFINPSIADSAVRWLVEQQQSMGLLKSWQEESACQAHIYDQALALLVFTNERMWTESALIVEALMRLQNDDGSWYKNYDCLSDAALTDNKWEGDNAWATFALSRYLTARGSDPSVVATRQRAADWLVTRIDPADGCLVIDHTEGTIDAWWALHAAGSKYDAYTAGLQDCLLSNYWDDVAGRFKGGRDWWQPYLDNQTWGAAFLTAIDEEQKAYRALDYAMNTLLLPSQGGQIFGFDGQGGPWSVWNEGAGQYVAMRGSGAETLLQELFAQVGADGGLSGSPDAFAGGVWATPWRGVSSTAWLYFAMHGSPFRSQASRSVYLPTVAR